MSRELTRPGLPFTQRSTDLVDVSNANSSGSLLDYRNDDVMAIGSAFRTSMKRGVSGMTEKEKRSDVARGTSILMRGYSKFYFTEEESVDDPISEVLSRGKSWMKTSKQYNCPLSVSVLVRYLNQQQTEISPFIRIRDCLQSLLQNLFVDWTEADDNIIMNTTQSPSAIVAHLQFKYTYKDAYSLLYPGSSSFQVRLDDLVKKQAGDIVSKLQAAVASKATTHCSVHMLSGIVLRSWLNVARRIKRIRRHCMSLLRLRGASTVRKAFSRWKSEVLYGKLHYNEQSEKVIQATLSERITSEGKLIDQVRILKSSLDTLRTERRALETQIAVMESNPSIVNLTKPLMDGEKVIHHGIIEFRHVTVDEWQQLHRQNQSNKVSEAIDIATMESKQLSDQQTDRYLRMSLQSVMQMSEVVAYPYLNTLERLGRGYKDLASEYLPNQGGQPQVALDGRSKTNYYSIIGVRSISQEEEIDATRKGRGFINRREILLSWANLKIGSGFPHEDLNVSEYRMTEYTNSLLDGKSYLLLLHVTVPYEYAQEITIDDIQDMGTPARHEAISKILSLIGITDYSEMKSRLESGFDEGYHNLLLAQLYCFDKLNILLRSKYANALRAVGVPVSGMLLSTFSETVGPEALTIQARWPLRRRGARRLFSIGTSTVNKKRKQSALLGLIPQSGGISPNATTTEPEPPLCTNSLRLVFQPGVGIRMLGKSSLSSKAVQVDIPNEEIESAWRHLSEERKKDTLVQRKFSRRLSIRRGGSTQSIISVDRRRSGSIRSNPDISSKPSSRTSSIVDVTSNGDSKRIQTSFRPEQLDIWQQAIDDDTIPISPIASYPSPVRMKSITKKTSVACNQTVNKTVELTSDCSTLVVVWLSKIVTYFNCNKKSYLRGVPIAVPTEELLENSWDESSQEIVDVMNETHIVTALKVMFPNRINYGRLSEATTDRVRRITSTAAVLDCGCVSDLELSDFINQTPQVILSIASLYSEWKRCLRNVISKNAIAVKRRSVLENEFTRRKSMQSSDMLQTAVCQTDESICYDSFGVLMIKIQYVSADFCIIVPQQSLSDVNSVLERHQEELYSIFRYYSLINPKRGICIGLNEFLLFCNDIKVLYNDSDKQLTASLGCRFTQSELERVFVMCNWPSDDVLNTPIGLIPSQFTEAIVRLAMWNTDTLDRLVSVSDFITEIILPNAVQSSIDQTTSVLYHKPNIQNCLLSEEGFLWSLFRTYCNPVKDATLNGMISYSQFCLFIKQFSLSSSDNMILQEATSVFFSLLGSHGQPLHPSLNFMNFTKCLFALSLIHNPRVSLSASVKLNKFIILLRSTEVV